MTRLVGWMMTLTVLGAVALHDGSFRQGLRGGDQ